MLSVTQRITAIQKDPSLKQPRGGYVPIKTFTVTQLPATKELSQENINMHPSLVGLAVEYLSKYFWNFKNVCDPITYKKINTKTEHTKRAEWAEQFIFNIAKQGLRLLYNNLDFFNVDLDKCTQAHQDYFLTMLLLSHPAIIKKAVHFQLEPKILKEVFKTVNLDQIYRGARYSELNEPMPTQETTANINIMLERTFNFLERVKPIRNYGDTLGFNKYVHLPNNHKRAYYEIVTNKHTGYTKIISKGDYDLLTEDTLWDFKTIKGEPTAAHTLQVLIYFLMAKKSAPQMYKDLKYIGIFNPKLNKFYKLEVATIDKAIIDKVKYKIIGYLPPQAKLDERITQIS